jgi:thymidylate synthase (FAD)
MVRHRTHSRNLESGRYKELEWLVERTAPDAWRLQSPRNKQGSAGLLTEWPPGDKLTVGQRIAREEGFTPGGYLTFREGEVLEQMESLYRERLKFGVAREQARKEVPFSIYYEGYDKVDLHNLMGFLALRLADDAQDEIQAYARAMAEIARRWVPRAYKAFLDYRLDAVRFSADELVALRRWIDLAAEGGAPRLPSSTDREFVADCFATVRESADFFRKMDRIVRG